MSQKQIEEYLAALTATEMDERARRGLPTTHVLDMADFPFRYAQAAFKEFIKNGINAARQNAGDVYGQMLGVYASILAGDYGQADAFMDTYSSIGTGNEPLRGMRFTRRVDLAPIELPAIEGHWPTGPSLFISCDPAYLRTYGMPLLRSIATSAPGSDVHVHIMGKAEAPRVAGLNITFTQELIPSDLPAREYFGAVRLARFAEALAAANAPLIMVDADALATADHRSLLTGDRAAMRIRAGRIEPWTHFSACCLRGTPGSLAYFQTVADIVLRTMRLPFWGMDQYALFSAFIQQPPPLELFGPDVASVVANMPGTFWFTAGNAKLALASDTSAYARLFQHFSGD